MTLPVRPQHAQLLRPGGFFAAAYGENEIIGCDDGDRGDADLEVRQLNPVKLAVIPPLRTACDAGSSQVAHRGGESMERKTDMFPLGRIVATPAALAALESAHMEPGDLLRRHHRGDWGCVHPEDEGLNDEALKTGGRLMSVYPLSTGVTIWIISEWDRSVTTLLLPEDY